MSHEIKFVESGEVTEVESEGKGSAKVEIQTDWLADNKSDVSEESQSEPRYSWLHVELAEYGLHWDHIEHCENILIAREGFTSKGIFARTPSSKITHDYLQTIDITHVGVQGVIVAVHSKLRDEVSSAELSDVPIPVVKWLRSKLNSVHALPHLQKQCEWKIVVQEGITSKDLFASLPDNVFNAAYLKKIGIEALGLQHVLLEWHAALHFAYIQQLNFMARSNKTCNNHHRGSRGLNEEDDRFAQNNNRISGVNHHATTENGAPKHSHKRGRDGEKRADID